MTHKFACFIAVFFSGFAMFAQAPAATGTSAAATATTTASTEVQQFQKIEDKWSEAVNNRDQYALELVLSPMFVGISASGDVTTRNQQLADVISEPDKTMHIDQRVITVRMLGDIVVANGTYLLHHKAGNSPVDEKGVFTHVFERQRNGWVCVNSQRTVLREDGPQGVKVKKKSDAELPFHIPLFSKSDKANQ